MPQSPPKYPLSPRHDTTEILHGQPISDPYRWLEDLDSPETRRWVAEQSALTQAYLEGLPGRGLLIRRLTELWDFEKFGVPVKHGGRYFFTYNDGLQNQSSLYWLESLSEEPRLLLDPNSLSTDGTVALTSFAVSHDGRLLAYSLSESGSDWQEWRVRRVEDGADLEDRILWSKFSEASWTQDNLGFYYSRYDAPTSGGADSAAYKDANYYQKLYYHRLGQPQSDDVLVYERPDHKDWGFSGSVTDDGRYLVMHVWMGTHRENGIFVQDLQQDSGQVIELLCDFDAMYEFAGNIGPTFYFLTDLAAPQGRLIAIDLAHLERQDWKTIIPESADTLQSVSHVGRHWLGVYLHDAHTQVQVFEEAGQLLHTVDLPGIGTVTGLQGQAHDPETFYHYTDFTTPGSVYRYDVARHRSETFRQPKVGFDPASYETRQVFYPSKDGTRVPMFITHKKGLVLSEATPTYLYGYGGFNIPQTPIFSVNNLVWMELGGVFALANLRGGGEYGKDWHMGGAKLNKQNVFDDFIAAAEWLIANGYTRPERLAIGGRSNGGLLTGACLTQRPDLYGAVLVIVGVLDMLRFHQFTIGWGWVSDYGSPDDPSDFQALLAYSPYHNVRPGTAYPPVLISTGDHDDRVFPAHSFKFAAALQYAQAGAAPVLIRIDTKAGHGVGKPTAKLIEETADQLAFVRYHLGQKE